MDKLSGLNEILKGVSGFTQGQSDASTASMNKKMAQKSGYTSSLIKQREANLATGSFINEASASGLTMSGSILNAISSSQRQGIEDAVNIKMQSDIEAINEKYKAKAAKRESYSAIGSGLLKAVPYFKKG